MFSEKSIKRKFLIQLVAASSVLIVIFSVVLYYYIKIQIYDDISASLKNEAVAYIKNSKSKLPFQNNKSLSSDLSREFGSDKMSVVIRVDKKPYAFYEQYVKDKKPYITIFYPYNKARSSFLKIERDISGTKALLGKIKKSIVITNILTLVLILAYAMFLSETLLYPVKSINRRLARMNENFLEKIDTRNLPDEYKSLGESVNKLIERIQNFVKYQKELFIGTAHELKTPLAVMKTKNEVTLIKDRDIEKYKETLRVNNKTIDEMSTMIGSILNIGRQEGAQFDKPVEVDLVQFIKDKAKDFELIAKNKQKEIKIDLEPEQYCIITQPSLLMHILQNFVQNALKFTPKNGTVLIKTRLIGDDFKIEIIDEGEGIDESIDLFAPFKRVGDKSGAGLGLFLAKGAADAIGAKLSIKNRRDGKSGAIATAVISSKNYCPMDEAPFGKRRGIFGVLKRES